MPEKADQNNSECGHISRNVSHLALKIQLILVKLKKLETSSEQTYRFFFIVHILTCTSYEKSRFPL